MSTLKKDFASKLLEVKAIKLQPNDPFTWASGWKSPFYCDNRKTLSFPWLRSYVKLELVHTILEHFPDFFINNFAFSIIYSSIDFSIVLFSAFFSLFLSFL